jgi:hypothetical protein
MMNKQLIYIVNRGCDASTYGLIEVDADKVDEYVQHINELNKNSYYDCMPKIHLFKAQWDWFREVDPAELKDEWSDVTIDNRLYYNGKVYTYKNNSWIFTDSEELRLN